MFHTSKQSISQLLLPCKHVWHQQSMLRSFLSPSRSSISKRSIMTSSNMAARIPSVPHVLVPGKGVDYRNKVVLAPMVRSGELPSRLMALHYGADLVWGPETVDRALIGCTVRNNQRTSTIDFTRVSSNGGRVDVADKKESVIYRLHPKLEGKQLIFQLGTASPELAVQAAELVAPHVAGIDVNAGCPKPFSTSGGMGAALLTFENGDRLCSILRALVASISPKYEIGISVKIRLLKTEDETRTLVEKLCKTGVTGLTIHCRTREMRKTEKAIREQLKMVGDICRAHGVACLMNGDVESREQALQLAADFGVDGGMIATAAEKNPSVFRAAADGGIADWKETVQGYIEGAIAVENRWGNTKFLLAQMMPGKEMQKCGLAQAKNYVDLLEKLAQFGIGQQKEEQIDVETLGQESKDTAPAQPSLLTRAHALDTLLGLTERLTKSEQKAQAHAKTHQHNLAQNQKRAAQCEAPRDGQLSKRQKKKLRQDQTFGGTEIAEDLLSQAEKKDLRQPEEERVDDYLTDLHADIVAPTPAPATATA